MIEMAVPGRRKRGRPRRRWMDLAREDIGRVGAKEGDEVDRDKWKIFLRCGKAKSRLQFCKIMRSKTTKILVMLFIKHGPCLLPALLAIFS